MRFPRSSQRTYNLQAAFKLCPSYIQDRVEVKAIVIFAGHLAQITLTKHAVALTPTLDDMDPYQRRVQRNGPLAVKSERTGAPSSH